MSKLAFENVSGDLFQLSETDLQKGLEASRKSDRKRIILPIHRKQEARVQRMINFLQPETYIRPHKHPLPNASESIVVIKGRICFFTFDDDGSVRSKDEIRSKPVPNVMDIEPNVWHSFLVLDRDTVLFECKKGPYDAETDKVFANWAPEEGIGAGQKWLQSL